jgi:hypothetical protein
VCVMYMCYNVYIYMDICMLGVNDEPDKMDMGILISFYTLKMRVRRRRVKMQRPTLKQVPRQSLMIGSNVCVCVPAGVYT